jgi:SAM-dependent methyltransferase
LPLRPAEASKQDVARFWERHPLGAYAIRAEVGSEEYFQELDVLRSACSRFVMDFYGFATSGGRAVLDVGCGPGWVARRYARAGAAVTAVDLTERAVTLARQWLAREGLTATVRQADAEALPFADSTFDWVSCDGVLHHTPDPERALREMHRVLRPSGGVCLSVYYENVFLRPAVFPVTRSVVRALGVGMHGMARLPADLTSDDLVRWYDGVDNPLGRAYSRRRAMAMLQGAGFTVRRARVFFFPARFLPGAARLPDALLRVLDRLCGTMIAVEGRKLAG